MNANILSVAQVEYISALDSASTLMKSKGKPSNTSSPVTA